MWIVAFVVFGAIGVGYFVYGVRQKEGIFLAAGVALSVFPLVISNPFALIGIGLALTIAPFVIQFQGAQGAILPRWRAALR